MLNKINIEDIKGIARIAGDAIMEIYNKDFSVEYKDDKSPLTEADKISHEIICNGLNALNSKFKIQNLTFQDVPVLSEEGKSIPYNERKIWDYFWMIDPIDGTKEFIKKNGEFTVNIALIYKGVPVLGVVYAPAINEMYAAKMGEGAFKNDQKLPLVSNSGLRDSNTVTVVASKSHLTPETQEFIDDLVSGSSSSNEQQLELISKGSSLKLCMVAEGVADIYPRLAPTMEWDTAAAHAIVLGAGKNVFQYHQNMNELLPLALEYNKADLLNPWFVVK